MIAACAVLFALIQEPTAEELLKKAEEKAAKSKSLVWKATVAGTAKVGEQEQKSNFEAVARFKEGNKAAVALDGNEAGKGRTLRIQCDGAKFRADFGRGAPATIEAPEGVGARLRVIAVRGGWMMIAMAASFPSKAVDEFLTAGDFKLGKDEKVGERNAKVIEYTLGVKVGPQDLKLAIKLWIDAETFSVLKRESKDGARVSMTETTTESSFDPDVKDDVFEVPK